MKFNPFDYLYPVKIFRLYRFLKKSQFFTSEQLTEYQNKELRKLVNHAYNHVPYYRELFDKHFLKPQDIQTVGDLVRVPVLTKELVRERFDDLVAENSHQFKPYLNKTSGSTGTPLRFLQDKNVSIARFAFFWRVWHMAGYRPWMKWAQVDGMFIGNDKRVWNYNLPLNSLQVSAISLNDENCEKIIHKLLDFKPRIIRGYPSAIYVLAKFLEKQNITVDLKLKSIITYSETLLPHHKELIERMFNCRTHDVFSMWEAVCLISECSSQSKHQHMELSVMELLDNELQVVGDGESGEIVATSLVNFSMPFIRYRTGDLAKWSGKTCNCGRNHKVVKEIIGRMDDFITTPEGHKIGRISPAFSSIQGIALSQIVQDKKDAVTVKIVKSDGFNDYTIASLNSELRKRLGNSIKIDFQIVTDIEPGKNGKRRLVVSNINKTVSDHEN